MSYGDDDSPSGATFCHNALVAGPSESDLELLEAWRAGDRRAGNALIQRHFTTVRRYLAAHGAGAQLDDLTQQTFEACVQGRDRVQQGERFRAYVLVIARRQLIAMWKKQDEKRAAVPFSQILLHDLRTSPTQALARQDLHRIVAVAMADLPDEFRRTLELFYWLDLSLQEIAEELGVALGTVKSRLHRGRGLLTSALQSMALDEVLLASVLHHVDQRFGAPDGAS